MNALAEVSLFLSPALLVVCAILCYLLVQFQAEAERVSQEYMRDTDWDRLQRKFQVKVIESKQVIHPWEEGNAQDAEALHVRAKQQALESLFQHLIDEEYILLVRDAMPAKKSVTYSARLYASRLAPMRADNAYNELADVEAEELMMA